MDPLHTVVVDVARDCYTNAHHKIAVAALIVSLITSNALLLSLSPSTHPQELISVGKYPAYAAYQRTTSRLLPWLPGPSLDSPQGKQLVQEALQKAGKKSH